MAETAQIALVTGGRRGIGLGIAQALAEAGWHLAICGTAPAPEAQAAVDELRKTGADVLYCQADISDAAARQKLIETVRDRFGRLDLLVNNAGVAPDVRADILDATEQSFERLIRINLQGPYFLTQLVARWMIEQKQADADFAGCIVNITSVSATTVSVDRGDYCLTKAALSMATKLWAVRLAEYGINVYELRPGVIETDMTAGVKAKYDELIGEQGILPIARWGRPEDVGAAVRAIAEGRLPYTTGDAIHIDGGFHLHRL